MNLKNQLVISFVFLLLLSLAASSEDQSAQLVGMKVNGSIEGNYGLSLNGNNKSTSTVFKSDAIGEKGALPNIRRLCQSIRLHIYLT